MRPVAVIELNELQVVSEVTLPQKRLAPSRCDFPSPGESTRPAARESQPLLSAVASRKPGRMSEMQTKPISPEPATSAGIGQ